MDTIISFVVSVLIAVSTASLFLNSLILATFVVRNRAIKARHICLVSLAAVDTIQSVTVLPLEIRELIESSHDVGTNKCQRWGVFTFFLSLNSIAHVTLLTIQRTWYIAYPYNFQQFLSRTSQQLYALASIWILSLTVASLPLWGWSKYTSYGPIICIPSGEGQLGSKAYSVFAAFFLHLLPTTAMIACYVVSKKAMRHLYIRSRLVFGTRKSSDATLQVYCANRKHTKMAIFMGLLFMIAWTPFAAVTLLRSGDQGSVSNFMWVPILLLMRSTNLSNPVVYTLIYSDFRRAVLAMLTRNVARSNSEHNPQLTNAWTTLGATNERATFKMSTLQRLVANSTSIILVAHKGTIS